MAYLFLSPSTQEYNPYATTGNEEYWMNRLADTMEPYLAASGINVTRNDPDGTVGSSVRASNRGKYDFHLALHSNAAPTSSAGQVRGIDVYYYPGSIKSRRMADLLVSALKTVYPLPERVRPVAGGNLYELRNTTAPAVLIELGYHDNVADAMWIENNLTPIARAIVQAVTAYFGLPFLSPQAVRDATVNTVSGSLNLRAAPSTGSAILKKLPQNATVTVLSEYNGWYVVRYEDTVGYVLGEYLRFS